jgi:hypothetical protein
MLDNALSDLLSRCAEQIASVRDETPPAAPGTSWAFLCSDFLIRSERSSPSLPKWGCRPSFPKCGRSSDHEGKGERHHDQPHLHKKRVSFSEHPPAFPPMESATAGARKTALWPLR